jgi:prevent-host-death family protein
MKKEIGSYEAKTKLPELLRQVQAGKSFTITNRGKAVADLVPSQSERSKNRIPAVTRLQSFIRSGRIKGVDIKALIEEGRA